MISDLEDTAKILAMVSTYDGRKFSPAEVLAWHDAWDRALSFEDARCAVSEHYRTSTDWLKPAHINRIGKSWRDERGQRNALPAGDPQLASMPAWFREEYVRHRKLNEGRYDKDAPRVDDGYNHLTGRWDA